MKNKSEKQNKLKSLLKNKVNETSKKVNEQAKDVYIKAIDSAQAGLEKAKQKSLNKESKEETIKENVSVDSINNFEELDNRKNEIENEISSREEWNLVSSIEDNKKKKRKKAIVAAVGVLFGLGAVEYGYEEITKVRSINFVEDNQIVYVGDEIDLTYEIDPINAKYEVIEYVTDDESIVDFQDNKCLAVNEGKTNVSIVCDGETFGTKEITVNPILVTNVVYDNLTIYVGESLEINPIIEPMNHTHNDYVLNSTNESIVQSKDNIIMGIKEGTTNLVISSIDGPSCTIEVNVIPVEATDIVIKEYSREISDSIDLCAKEFTVVTVEFEPKNTTYKDLEFISSNPTIFEVDENGKIKANKYGNAKLTVKHNEDVYKEIDVHVDHPHAEKVSISANNKTVYVGGQTKLYANVSPNPCCDTDITWSSDDKRVVTVDEKGNIEAIGEGEAEITCEVGGVYGTITIKVIEKPVVKSVTRSNTGGASNDVGTGGGTTYVLNANSHKFHYSYCKSVKQMKESNKIYSNLSRDEIIAQGYDPCKNCNP